MKKKRKIDRKNKDKEITTYKQVYQVAKQLKLVNTLRLTLLILRNEFCLSQYGGRGKATIQQTMVYLLNTLIINDEEHIIKWLNGWHTYLTPFTIHETERVKMRIKQAFKGEFKGIY